MIMSGTRTGLRVMAEQITRLTGQQVHGAGCVTDTHGLRVLSLGAGVQSSTLLLMAVHGELRLDAAIFADTQWESRAVYEWLDRLERIARVAGIPVYRVTAGNLRADSLWRSKVWLPLHIRNQRGGHALLRRQCTTNYKVQPILRKLRELGATARHPAVQLIGISLDEVHRMRDSGVRYVRHEYPLVERRMTRQDCLAWLERHGYPRPPRSACLGCPYKGNREWRELRDRHPDEWADTVAFDRAVRHARAGFECYLHASLVPLDQVDLRTPQDRGQLELDGFAEECSGVCGV